MSQTALTHTGLRIQKAAFIGAIVVVHITDKGQNHMEDNTKK